MRLRSFSCLPATPVSVPCRSIDLPVQLQLRTVARQRFRLTAVGEGLHAFVPVNFDAEYLVALPTTVHAASLGLSLGLPR